MERKIVIPLMALCMTTAVAFEADSAYRSFPRQRYDVIVDKQPFGPLPPGFVEPGANGVAGGAEAEVKIAAPEEVLAAQEDLSRKLLLQCVNIAPCGDVMVGFIDESDQGARYYLAIGDARRGYSILDADYDREWAQIVKDGIMVTLKLGEGKIETPPGSAGEKFVFTNVAANATSNLPGKRQIPATRSQNFVPNQSINKPMTLESNAQGNSEKSSFVERLRKREADRRKREEQDAEKQKQHLRELVRAAAKAEIEKQKREEAEQASEASGGEE